MLSSQVNTLRLSSVISPVLILPFPPSAVTQNDPAVGLRTQVSCEKSGKILYFIGREGGFCGRFAWFLVFRSCVRRVVRLPSF